MLDIVEIRFYSRRSNFAWLSNFSPHGFTLGGRAWPTVEHFYQALKFWDENQQERVRQAPTPGEAKRRGREPGMRPDWDLRKEAVMQTALRAKFSYEFNPNLVDRLKGTGSLTLIEDSLTDYYWGCGIDDTGMNRLGHLLMSLRSDPKLGETPEMIVLPAPTLEPEEDWSDVFDLHE